MGGVEMMAATIGRRVREGVEQFARHPKHTLAFRGPTGRVRDYVIRMLHDDHYVLPLRHRYVKSYFKHRAGGDESYELISTHTENWYESDESVLEIGCGAGRIASAFARVNPELNYVGIEIAEDKVRALNRRYEGTNFEFIHVDLANDLYNPSGSVSPDTVSFDLSSDTFDLIYLNSVFTHVRPPTVENYLGQLRDLLTTDGVVWATWYLIIDETDRTSHRFRQFTHDFGDFYSAHEEIPENSIAHPEPNVRDMVAGAGLEVDRRILGSWRDGDEYQFDRNRYYQDVTVLRPD